MNAIDLLSSIIAEIELHTPGFIYRKHYTGTSLPDNIFDIYEIRDHTDIGFVRLVDETGRSMDQDADDHPTHLYVYISAMFLHRHSDDFCDTINGSRRMLFQLAEPDCFTKAIEFMNSISTL